MGEFIGWQYEKADIDPEAIDTGALILTGLAARTANARAIGALFAGETGRFVAVAAGDGLETILAAHGSGAVAASLEGIRVMNVDIGGGTSKIAVCEKGMVADHTAIDVGARLVQFDDAGRITQIEPAGQAFADAAGVAMQVGATPEQGALQRIAAAMAEALFEACGGAPIAALTRSMLRLPPLRNAPIPTQLSFSGGVAEYITGREPRRFGDLGPCLADAVTARLKGWGPRLRFADAAIRATVIGASQHSVQLSGNTIFVTPTEILPLHNLAVIAPALPLDAETIDADAVAAAIQGALRSQDPNQQVALGYRWQGAATHARIDAFCTGVTRGLAPLLAQGMKLVLVGESDVGGLIGLHLGATQNAVVSIDGIVARDLDYIDIGEILQISGGVPVVVKSLVFPGEA